MENILSDKPTTANRVLTLLWGLFSGAADAEGLRKTSGQSEADQLASAMAYLQFLVSYRDVKSDRVRERSPGAGFLQGPAWRSRAALGVSHIGPHFKQQSQDDRAVNPPCTARTLLHKPPLSTWYKASYQTAERPTNSSRVFP